jgi:hypothetical protein
MIFFFLKKKEVTFSVSQIVLIVLLIKLVTSINGRLRSVAESKSGAGLLRSSKKKKNFF